jgi:hypothetical protein
VCVCVCAKPFVFTMGVERQSTAPHDVVKLERPNLISEIKNDLKFTLNENVKPNPQAFASHAVYYVCDGDVRDPDCEFYILTYEQVVDWLDNNHECNRLDRVTGAQPRNNSHISRIH